MESEAWAAIIAAIITMIGTVVTTRFEDISNLLRRSSRRIAGDWESTSYKICAAPNDPGEFTLTSKQFVQITQKGNKVRAVMTQTEVMPRNAELKKFTWNGEVKGDYFIYQSEAINPELFLVSSAMLYIHRGGKKMFGYFISSGRRGGSKPTWVGYTEMIRKGS